MQRGLTEKDTRFIGSDATTEGSELGRENAERRRGGGGGEGGEGCPAGHRRKNPKRNLLLAAIAGCLRLPLRISLRRCVLFAGSRVGDVRFVCFGTPPFSSCARLRWTGAE